YQAADILDPELFESRASADVAQLEAIVEAVAPHLMSECVELGADLAKLGDDKLLVDLAGVGYWRRRLGVDVEYAASIDEGLRGIGRQHRPELKHLAGSDQLCRAQNCVGLHHVGRSALVAGPPFGRAALIVWRHLPGLGIAERGPKADGCGDGDDNGEWSHWPSLDYGAWGAAAPNQLVFRLVLGARCIYLLVSAGESEPTMRSNLGAARSISTRRAPNHSCRIGAPRFHQGSLSSRHRSESQWRRRGPPDAAPRGSDGRCQA